METVSIIAAAMGVAWASGINLYAAMLMLGLMGNFGYVELPTDLQVLQKCQYGCLRKLGRASETAILLVELLFQLA